LYADFVIAKGHRFKWKIKRILWHKVSIIINSSTVAPQERKQQRATTVSKTKRSAVAETARVLGT